MIDEAFVRDLIRSCLVLLPPPNVTWRRVRRAATESGSSSLLIRSFQSEGLSLRKRLYCFCCTEDRKPHANNATAGGGPTTAVLVAAKLMIMKQAAAASAAAASAAASAVEKGL